MTTYTPPLPLAADPLIAEAKQRARHRRLLAAIALVLVAAASAAALVVTRPSPTPSTVPSARLEACGILGIGIGWAVHASPAPGCEFARKFVTQYFAHAHAPTAFAGFTCTSRALPDAAHIRCSAGPRVVLARSEGY
jgi:hypothetical protein